MFEVVTLAKLEVVVGVAVIFIDVEFVVGDEAKEVVEVKGADDDLDTSVVAVVHE